MKTCPGCDQPLGEASGSVGDTARGLDAMPVMTHEGGILYLCIPCAQKACSLAREILAITKSRYAYFPNLFSGDPVPGDPLRKFPVTEGS